MKQEDKMSKTKLVPFDVGRAKQGAKVVTRCGFPVRIVLYDLEDNRLPIIAAVRKDEKEIPGQYTIDGNFYPNKEEDALDLFIEEEVEEDDSDYDPYKSTVESIADMVERYSELQTLEELKHFYNNIKVKCREAIEYDSTCKKQDEKPADNKPKFKVGDFIVNDYCMGKVTVVTDDAYLLDTGQGIPFSCDNTHLWTIKDAKPGDILYYSNSSNNTSIGMLMFKELAQDETLQEVRCYCEYNTEDGLSFETCIDNPITRPASIELCKQLFIMIKEAGYQWDAENKELKKINKEDKRLKQINKEVKTRRMTNQELADWLCQCPEECREFKYKTCSTVLKVHVYYEEKANEPAENILIRKNHGEWEEPVIEIK